LGVADLHAFLKHHHRVSLDTSVFIYHTADHAKYFGFTNSLFSWLEKPGSKAITSTVTLTELLVLPIRSKDEDLVGASLGLLSRFPNLEWIPVSIQIAALGARYRAEYGLRTPDAVQGATCVYSGVSGLITNDRVFQRIPELDILVLDDLL
jgi:predicted nucleic acid-binding protein